MNEVIDKFLIVIIVCVCGSGVLGRGIIFIDFFFVIFMGIYYIKGVL